MTISDSQKIVTISSRADFQDRIRSVIIRKVLYAIETSDSAAADKLAAGRKIWSSRPNLEFVGVMILGDPNVLVKCAEDAGGIEVTDYDLEAKTDASLLRWGQVLS